MTKDEEKNIIAPIFVKINRNCLIAQDSRMNCTRMLKYEYIGFTVYIRLIVKSLLYHLTEMQGRCVRL